MNDQIKFNMAELEQLLWKALLETFQQALICRRKTKKGWLRPWPAWMKIRRKHAARCKKSIFCHHDFNLIFATWENRLNRSAFTMRFTRSSGPW